MSLGCVQGSKTAHLVPGIVTGHLQQTLCGLNRLLIPVTSVHPVCDDCASVAAMTTRVSEPKHRRRP